MRIFSFALSLVAAQAVAGHTVFTTLFVNDVDQGDGTCVRMPMTPNNATSPINDLASNDMACGYDGTIGVARVCPVNQSSKLSFMFREWADGSQVPNQAIDPSHLGPCAVYMKAVDSAINDTAVGDGWFKIWEETYDSTTSQWCTEKLIQNGGFLSVDVPSDLAGGYYLVRPEVLALHQADKTPPNPQFYVGCAQIFLNSTAISVPQDTVSIPGYVNISNPSVLFNVWSPRFPYPDFGPVVYTSASAEETNVKLISGNNDPTVVQNEGLLPQNVILTNANWWGIELDSYSTQDGCWNGSKACWAQCTTCYGTAPPTGSKNCKIWEAKCRGIVDACNAGNYTGPPSMGADLNPPVSTFSIPAALTTAPTPESTLVPDSPATTASTLASTSPSSSPGASSNISQDGTCGGGSGNTCLGSTFGNCCSTAGWCGSSTEYCGSGCQSEFEDCGDGVYTKREVSPGRYRRSYIGM